MLKSIDQYSLLLFSYNDHLHFQADYLLADRHHQLQSQ